MTRRLTIQKKLDGAKGIITWHWRSLLTERKSSNGASFICLNLFSIRRFQCAAENSDAAGKDSVYLGCEHARCHRGAGLRRGNLPPAKIPNAGSGGETFEPTGPHDYLGYARRCFNSALRRARSDAAVSVSYEDWMACQRGYNPPRDLDLEPCRCLAELMKKDGRVLRSDLPDKDENAGTHSLRVVEELVEECTKAGEWMHFQFTQDSPR